MIRIDTQAIKQRVNLLELIGNDTTLKRVANTRGGEYAGPCPFCGGKDRLRVQPATGRWVCRQCGDVHHWPDAIAYVQKRHNLDFRAACEWLNGGGDLPTGNAPATTATGALPGELRVRNRELSIVPCPLSLVPCPLCIVPCPLCIVH